MGDPLLGRELYRHARATAKKNFQKQILLPALSGLFDDYDSLLFGKHEYVVDFLEQGSEILPKIIFDLKKRG